jgi:hypothetical protein
MSTSPAQAPSIDVENEVDYPPQKKVWHHTTLFNAFVIGGVGFMAPGLWNAVCNSLLGTMPS